MKLFDRFRRPLWQHPDTLRRAEAVRSESAPELLRQLPQIAASDNAAEVRRAAIARIDSAETLLGLLGAEKDSGCREAILGRVRARLLDAGVPAAERQQLASHAALPPELAETMAESTPEPELREAAVLRLNKPGLLQRRCLKDPDPALRLRLLEHITDEATLDRITEAARGQDKALSRRAREKADALKLARGDAGAITHRALQLGTAFDALARSLPADAEEQLAALEAEVEQLSPRLDASLLRRLQGHAASARAAVKALKTAHLPKPVALEAVPVEAGAVDEAATAAATVAAEPADDAVNEALAADTATVTPADADGAVNAATDTATVAPAPAAAQPPDEALREALRQGLAGVEEQRLGVAKPALEAARARLAAGIKPTQGQRDRLRELEAGVAEMERWQRWAGNKVRARLCDEVEALIGSGLHPDAVANRVKELQEEWARVEAAEPDHGEHAAGIGKRFRALCHRALAPARPYFEQRRALRSQKAGEIDATITALAAEIEQGPEDLKPLRERVVAALRELDEVEPRARAALGKRLRAQLERLDALRDARNQAAVEGKQALLERLRFAARGDAAQAINVAKAIQQEWRNAPRADRKTEDRLWAELRAIVDPLFEAARAGAQARTEALAAVEAERRGLVEAVQALAQAEDLGQIDAQLAELEARWQAQQPQLEDTTSDGRPGRAPRDRSQPERGERGERQDRRPRPPRAAEGSLDREFEKAVERLRAAQKAQREARAKQSLQALLDAALDASKDGALSESERRELATARARDVSGESREDALIGLELDAGVDSPVETAARRRELQMQRLAERMGSGAARPDARAALLAWAAHAPQADAAQNARAARALKALLG
jgi:exonuclease SbcC